MKKQLSELNFATLTNHDFFPSPAAREDQVLYFLMLDRFSDGKEQGHRDNEGNIVASGITPMFKNEDRGNATRTAENKRRWFEAGGKFIGGTVNSASGLKVWRALCERSLCAAYTNACLACWRWGASRWIQDCNLTNFLKHEEIILCPTIHPTSPENWHSMP
ncbi:MAG: hypothetical protein ONB46_23465 [candidate division KSB1 bacterium]|nr:hypothetical protein [candidate division KSB1 bacterium]MDZ7368826.1 hypothetical protein [candidate division KSB1 bacterium]MDZ7406670.1 hypothetical protein [candidate division KSB1 bacterium]